MTTEHQRVSLSWSEALFARVSGKYSASITAQAATIALECKKHKTHPRKLIQELIHSTEGGVKREHLSAVATKAHAHIPIDEQPNVDPHDIHGLKGVLWGVLERADQYMRADEDKLEKIIGRLWDEYYLSYTHAPKEERGSLEELYGNKASELIYREDRFPLLKTFSRSLRRLVKRT